MNTLAQLSEGEGAFIRDLKAANPLRRRLIDLGMTDNAYVEVLHKSPTGNPIACCVCGSVIALRLKDAGLIEVERREMR